MRSRSNTDERNIYFIYLLLILLFSVTIISWLSFRNYNINHGEARMVVYKKIEREKKFLKKQKEAMTLIDTTYKTIKIFNPAINAIYADNDIKNQLKNIRSYYTDNGGDVHYRVFSQTVALYSMLLDDKKILQKKQSNVLMFKRELQECQIGFKDGQNKMNLKAVLQQGDKNEPK